MSPVHSLTASSPGAALIGLEAFPPEFRGQASISASLMIDRYWRASAPNSLRALKADLDIYAAWCRANGQQPVPASPGLVVWFLDDMLASGKSAATIGRYRASLAKAHQLLELDDPCRHQLVSLTLRGARRAAPRPRGQAPAIRLRGNTSEPTSGTPLPGSLMGLLAACDVSSRAGLRDRALLSTAYDTGLRRSELAALNVGNLQFDDDGTGVVLVARSKTDQHGEGSYRFLARRSVSALRAWISVVGDQKDDAPLFRRVDRWGVVGARLAAAGVPPVLRRAAARAAIQSKAAGDLEGAEVYARLSKVLRGHSTRVGVAQDMTAQGADLLAIMNAFDWRSPKMPLQYVKAISTKTSSVAKALLASDER